MLYNIRVIYLAMNLISNREVIENSHRGYLGMGSDFI